MLSEEEYSRIVSELLDELPAEFFRELSGGVIMSEAVKSPSYARADDLFTLGEYQISSGIRQVVMYRGSFDRVYPHADTAQATELLRGILRHEFRHHMESLGGIHNSSSLEAEDEREKQAYLARAEEPDT
ncbi:MAG: hypothetical protein Q3984_03055 [Eubacteriales bacterium]|nr:hypothetical protein [Eubacteriales bacterium]